MGAALPRAAAHPRRPGAGQGLAADHPGLSDVLGKLADGIAVEGMEAFAPVLAERMELLLDHVPAGGCVLACDPERIRTRAAELVRTSQEFLEASWVNAAAGGEAPIDLGEAAFRPITEVRARGRPARTAVVDAHPVRRRRRRGRGRRVGDGQGSTGGPTGQGRRAGGATGRTADPGTDRRQVFVTGASPAEAYRGDTARVFADVARWLADGWRVVTGHRGPRPGAAARRAAARARVSARGSPTWTSRPSPACRTWPPA